MKTSRELSQLMEDLAAHWTEPALEILKNAGLRILSVDTEVKTWRTLTVVLRQELRWQRSFRVSTLLSLGTLMEQVLRKATLRIAQTLAPDVISAVFHKRIRHFAGERRATEAERRLFGRIVRQPSLPAAFKAPSWSDFTPHLLGSTVTM